MKTSLEIRYVYWKSKVLQDAPAKLCGSFFLLTRTMQVLFVLRSRNPGLRFRNGRKDKQFCQKDDVCIKTVSSYRYQCSLFSDP